MPVEAGTTLMHDSLFMHNGETFLAYVYKNDALRIARLTEHGDLDTSFGTSGWIQWTFPRTSQRVYQADSIAVVDDGFIITAGGSGGIQSSGYLIVKLDRSGNLVPDFGTQGYSKSKNSLPQAHLPEPSLGRMVRLPF